MKKTNFILSLIFNSLLIVCEIWALSIGFFGWYPGYQTPTAGAVDNFRFFTQDSNLFLLLATILFLVASIIGYKGKKAVPTWIVVLKFTATVSVLTTFLVVMTMLLPNAGVQIIGWPAFLFTHVICPILALATFAFIDVMPSLKKRDSFFAIAPILLYTAVIAPLASMGVIDDPYGEIGLLDLRKMTPLEITWKWCAIFFGTLLVGFLLLLLHNLMSKVEKKPETKTEEQPSAYHEDRGPEAIPTHELAADDVVVIEDDEGAEAAEEEQEIKDEEEAKKTNPTGYMNRPRVYHIAKQADTGKWQVRLATGQKAIKLFDTQELAINYAKGLVKTQGGSIRVHSLKGKMRKE